MSELVYATAVSPKSGTTCNVNINGIVTAIQVARDVPVALGDVLIVARIGLQWIATGRAYLSAPAAPDNPSVPVPKPAETVGTLVVSPVETRSYRTVYNGWRNDNTNVYQGQYGGQGNHTGCVFYGAKPRSLDGATVTKATIKVKRSSGGAYAAQPTTMRLMTNAARPGGAPTLTSSTAGPSLAVGSSETFTIPTSWAQSIVNGTAGGLAFYESDGSPYVVFAGRSTWSPAFTLSISWKRV